MNFILKDNFKDILRNLRLEKGLLQKEMAKKLNVSLSTYSKYEQGTSTPNKENLIKIWNFFGSFPTDSKDYVLISTLIPLGVSIGFYRAYFFIL